MQPSDKLIMFRSWNQTTLNKLLQLVLEEWGNKRCFLIQKMKKKNKIKMKLN